jgi:alpha-beta hydrolase superfamily lysophospholipase
MIINYSDRHSKFTITTSDGKNIQGIRIKPEKPVCSLIVVHGVGEHLKRYLSFAEKISAINCTCYLYDQRGHGNSDGKRGHI